MRRHEEITVFCGSDRKILITVIAKRRGTTAENFGFGRQLYMNLKTDDRLILFAHLISPPVLPVLAPRIHRDCTQMRNLRG